MYKVMIVDDEDIIVNGLSRAMPWAQYHCEVIATASDGISAQAKIRELHPDILFTDICMPGADGLAMLAAVRSEFPAMQVTILSGYPDFEYAQKAIQLGVVRYVLKPSKFSELEAALGAMTENLRSLGTAEPEEAPSAAQNFILQNAMAYIGEHYAEKLTLTEVAEKVYVSQWHLSKLISKNTNQGFSDLLNGVRIHHAKELLRDPAMKIWEISEAVGFADVTHFSRIFKKVEGMSANEYRHRVLSIAISKSEEPALV
ncbi:response regulator [Pygmaiobacter massiliensis]|uniref:response regulator transcription factor n=1 Tax=Pygmaiobacter massiliensis TaxID=1917873 RepID=UPI002A7F1770|nr:response regulator [Pygmaiobacter massiliensis]MDY4785349.1 response regulator [Pygmaiobacter massiliensis]